MAVRMSSVKTAFLLFTEDQEENCEKLRTVLEYNSDGCICIVDLALTVCGSTGLFLLC